MVIARGTGRIPVMGHRILMSGDHGKDVSGAEDACFDDMVFGFLEEGEGCMDSSSISSGGTIEDFDDGDDDEQENSGDVEKSKAFWESQHQLLQGTLSRTSSLETKIRKATKEALRESQLQGVVCVCRKLVSGCRSCLLRDISDRLRRAGIECGICKSKWKSSPDIPAAGEHTYLDYVVDKTSSKGEIRVIIELNFRAEFEMARANEEYNKLISRLPEVFLGKEERLKSAIKILCTAAKKCMKENKMHMGPWRKHKYMQAKWFGTCERTLSEPLQKRAVNRPKPRASMLTFEMVDKLPSMQHFTAVEVV